MIYCVEDDKNILDLIIYTLNSVGYQAQGFQSSLELFPALSKAKPELFLLDVMLPNESGLDILKQLKNNISTENIPVIMLTAKNSEFDKVTGLDLGADDYVTKPFGVMELVARIKAVLRRNQQPMTSNDLTYQNLNIDLDRHIVTVNKVNINLTLKEYQLLQKLMENKGRVLTREQLLEDIWGYDYFGETRTVDVHIRTLRSKINEASNYIETIRGVGYRFKE